MLATPLFSSPKPAGTSRAALASKYSRSHPPRPGRGEWVRYSLVIVALTQLVIALPDLVARTEPGTTAHESRHVGAMAVALAGNIHACAPGDGNYGPATMPSQISVISSHIKAAIKDGGQFAYGSLKSVQAPFVQPVILVDVPESSAAVREETFGPIIIINRVAHMKEAIELSNASRYGLGANIWSKRQGSKIASQLHCGMVAINSTFSFAAIPSVPFGGVKDSGYGRVHGPEGLLEYTYPRTVVRTRFNIPLHFLSFKRRAKDDKLVIKATKILKGRLG